MFLPKAGGADGFACDQVSQLRSLNRNHQTKIQLRMQSFKDGTHPNFIF